MIAPRSTLQLACDSPSNSLIARAAAAIPMKPPARLMTKEDNWPPLMSTFCGHESLVNSVAISADGQTVVSASVDKTVRWGQWIDTHL